MLRRKWIEALVGLGVLASLLATRPVWAQQPVVPYVGVTPSAVGGQVYQPVSPTNPLAVTSTPSTLGGALPSSTIIPNNTTAVVVKGSPGQVYGIECFNNSATIAYLKLYDATSATAGSGTPVMRQMCPSSTAGAGFVISYPTGRQFSTGITYVMTTGIADNDTTAPAASTYIVNVYYK